MSPGEEVRLWHQILISIQQFPHIVPFFLHEHPEELAVHWAGQAHLLIILQDNEGTATNYFSHLK